MMHYSEAVQAKHARSLICDKTGREGVVIGVGVVGVGTHVCMVQWSDGTTAQVELVALQRKLEELR